MQSTPRSIISVRPPSSTGAWSLVSLDRRLPDSVEPERELQAGSGGFELWVKPLPEECDCTGIDTLAHSPQLLRWHRENAIKVLLAGLTRDLRTFKSTHWATPLLERVLPPAAGPDRFARVHHVRQLAAVVVHARRAVAAGLSRGEQAVIAALELLPVDRAATHAPCYAAEEEGGIVLPMMARSFRGSSGAPAASMR